MLPQGRVWRRKEAVNQGQANHTLLHLKKKKKLIFLAIGKRKTNDN